MAIENVIIEFTAETSGLAPAIDQLEALGKVDKASANIFKQTNDELKNRAQVTKMTSEEFKKTGLTLEQLAAKMRKGTDETKKFTDVEKQLRAELEKIKNQLKLSNEEFDKLKNGANKTAEAHKSLRQELRQITEQLTKLKLEGRDNTEQYKQLSAQASKYRDALGDVGREINRAASDTRKLDTMVEFATGVAGAFSIAQGAAGLFGDKSEELQEVLLRVQSAMAVLNGLQAIQNILQKESNLIRFVTNQQLKIQVITTNLQTAAQSKNVIVSTLAAGAMRVLNAVMSTNPAFLLIGAFALLAGALAFFTSSAKESEKAAAALNAELDQLRHNADVDRKAISNATEIDLKRLELRGAKESELQKRRIQDIKENIALENKNADDILAKQKKITEAIEKDRLKKKSHVFSEDDEKLVEARKKAREDEQESFEKSLTLNTELQKAEIELGIVRKNESKEANDKAIENSKKAAEKRKEFRLKELEDIKAGIELQLLEVAKGSQAEIDLKKKLSISQLNIDLENEKLTANQRKLLIQQSFKERIKLEKDFSAEERKRSLENLQSNLNAELQEIDISNQRKEDLTIQLLEIQRQLELAAVIGNKEKEKEINAKFDKEISEQAVAIRKAGLDEELRLLEAQAGAKKRALEKQTGSTTPGGIPIDIKTRIDAINTLLKYEQNNIEKRKELNDSLYKDGLISAKEFQLTTAELADQEAKAVEDAEARKRAAYKETDERRMQNAFELTRQTIDTLATLYDFVSARETVALETQRQRIKDLQDAGAISEKEAKERNKRLDIEERKIKQQQAQRNKAIEVFNALLAIPAAFLKGLKDGGPILAALYAGLAGAQAALIAARPIPKFGRGKKNMYEGVGQVGETGPELIEKKGKYYMADKPQIVWLAKSDKVYDPKETIAMINRPLPNIDKRIMNFSSNNSSHTAIDYKKLGKAVGENIPQVGFNFDENGFTQYQRDKESFTRYLNKRRSF